MEEGTILKTSQHPYGYYPGCAKDPYFNPDLRPRWTRVMMGQNGAIFNTQERLKYRYGVEYSQETIAQSYGVLIAGLWEEAYAQGWLSDS